MAKKKQSSNATGLVLLGLLGLGLYYFGTTAQHDANRPAARTASATQSAPAKPAPATSVPLSAPRYVNVATLNVRHTPSTTSPLVMTLPRGTALRALARDGDWLLIDINPTLEGWVAESLTTTKAPQQNPVPPAALTGSR